MIFVKYALFCLFLWVAVVCQSNSIHCAPVIDTTHAGASVAELPPDVFPSDVGRGAPPKEFPSGGSNVRRMQSAVAPRLFPSNQEGVLQVNGAPITGTRLVTLPPCHATDSGCLFPTVAGKLPIMRPSEAELVVILVNLRNRTIAMNNAHNAKSDAVLLEDGPKEPEDAVEHEEEYGPKTNNLMALNLMTSDDTIVLDRPHESIVEPRSMLMSVMLTVSVLGVCMLLSMLVWRKYVQNKLGLHQRLIDEEETMEQP